VISDSHFGAWTGEDLLRQPEKLALLEPHLDVDEVIFLGDLFDFLFATVPDYIVSQVLEHLWADPACSVVTATREEEALGILSGAWLGGQRGALLMQNSGLGNCVNTLGSLNVASQLPVVLVISHRGDLGEFNPAQVPVGQATERILDAVSGKRSSLPLLEFTLTELWKRQDRGRTA